MKLARVIASSLAVTFCIASGPIKAMAQSQPTNPPSLLISNQLTPADQKEMDAEVAEGKEAADQIAKSETFVTDPIVIGRVQAIGAKVAAIADTIKVHAGFGNSSVYPFHYTYHVLKSKEVNAFSLPGGYIYIYKGMLDLLSTDDELAAVLGHETAHAAHHHVPTLMHEASKMNTQLMLGALAAVLAHVPMQDIGNLAVGTQLAQQGILNNHFSEQAEEDADHTGMIFAMRAGYNPVGMYAMLMCLKQQEDRSPDVELGYLRDHPLTSQRLDAARAELISLGNPITPHSLREAQGTMIASVNTEGPTGQPTDEVIYVGTTPIAKVVPGEREDAIAAAKQLNQLLDDNLQLYEVKAQGSNLIVRDIPLISFSDADAALAKPAATPTSSTQPVQTASSVASSAAVTLRNILWTDAVTGTTDTDIEVGDTVSAMP